MRSFLLMVIAAFVLSALCFQVHAQTINLPGKVLEENGDPVPGASVRLQGAKGGVVTKDDGTFSIKSPLKGVLIISALGFGDKQVDIAGLTTVTVTLVKTNKELDQVVVTAYGIKRAKNTLPYAAQSISGDEANKVRVDNIAQGMSGKVSGLQVIQNNALGGSVNVVIRGTKSLSFNNQALFVIDGVPFDNTTTNSSSFTSQTSPNSTAQGTGGYDYGNAAADINPDDVASINVLKGAAATALYGSRAANGVVMITTKKSRSGLNVTVNSGMTLGRIDKSTFVKLQHDYGAGRSDNLATGGFVSTDVNGDGVPDLAVNANSVRSWGPKFDKTIQVYAWDAFDPSSPTYHKTTAWTPGAHGPDYFYETAITNNESVMMDGANANGSFKVGYSRNNDKGDVPNSNFSRHAFNVAGSYKLTNRLTASAAANYYIDAAVGRYATGYDANRNPNVVFRQYGQTDVDYKEQKEAYNRHQQNITWNWLDVTRQTTGGLVAAFYNNTYFAANQNFEDDNRNRIFGNTALNYQVTDWLNIMGRVSVDYWSQFEEERVAVTSVGVPYYTRTNSSSKELNYDLLATGNHKLSENFKLSELLGINIRKDYFASIYQTTNGGLIVPNLYSITNTKSQLSAPYELAQNRAVDGYFAGATLSYRDFLTLDGSFRRDRSSTLPTNANAYNYYGISGSWVFFQHLRNLPWLSSGKLRANYATVGNDAPVQSVQDVYTIGNIYGSSYQFSNPTTKNNPTLVPERTNSEEAGVEISFLKNRLGFDASVYHTNTINQIIPIQTSSAIGYNKKFVNAGNVRNQGIELSLFGSPVQTKNFSWDINVNWTRNRNQVLSLNNGSSNLVLGSFQGGVTLNASVGKPYGIIEGPGFVFTNGKPTVVYNAATPTAITNGTYAISPISTTPIGNINPDWYGGITNTFKYKSFSVSFLIDIRQGGNVWSLDQYYAQMSGILQNSVGKNDLGNDKRLPVANGGGVILPGVTADGKPNTIRVQIQSSTSTVLPQSQFSYNASYVKLREVNLTYHFPDKALGNLQHVVKGIDFSLLGRNLWLIHKDSPMSDPEETISAGNLQGYQSGGYPTVRSLGLNVKVKF